MQITINTLQGTFVVPSEKEAQLIAWLQANAVKLGAQTNITEVRTNDTNYQGTQLLNG